MASKLSGLTRLVDFLYWAMDPIFSMHRGSVGARARVSARPEERVHPTYITTR